MIEFGDLPISDVCEFVIKLAKTGMRSIIFQLVILSIALFILSIAWDLFVTLILGNNLSTFIGDLMSEAVWMGIFLLILCNWMHGLNILENLIEPLMFRDIPNFIFNFSVGSSGQTLINPTNNIALNIDDLYNTLMEIPDKWFENPNMTEVLIDWLLKAKLGFYMIRILFKPLVYILVILLFIDILKMILGIHLLYIFAGIIIPLYPFKFFRNKYGLNTIKTIIITAIQYYFIFIMVGFLNGYVFYLESLGEWHLILGAMFALMFIKAIIAKINELGRML